MKIKKVGHCCFLIQIQGLTILTDPGIFSSEQDEIQGIDIVLITHEHPDHLHIESLQKVLVNNPSVQIITNSGVGKQLEAQGISYTLIEGRANIQLQSVMIEAFDERHVEIFEQFGQVQNTGYFIGDKLFYPGDSYCKPGKDIEVLALPVSGPWCKVADAIRYAIDVQPKKVFPVHDGNLRKDRIGGSHRVPATILAEKGIEFFPMFEGDEKEF